MTASVWNPGAPTNTTLAPIAPVPFVKGTAALPGITFAGDTNTGIWSGADGTIYFSINGTTVLSLQADGTVASNGVLSIDTEAELASAATIDLGGQGTNSLLITGSTNITSFGVNYNGPIFVRFSGALTLTNSSTLILPSGANIVTASNDTAVVVPKTSSGVEDGWIVVSYQKASGAGLTTATDLSNSVRIDVASAATVDLTTGTIGSVRNLNITGVIGINGFTVSAGALFFVRFAGVLVLTNGAPLTTQTGANITTAVGDTCILRALSANTVELLCYVTATPLVIPSPVGATGKFPTSNGAAYVLDFLRINRQAVRSTNTVLAAADHQAKIDYYSATVAADFTQTWTAAATLGNGWWTILRNLGLGVGANAIVNGTFATNTDWTLDAGVTISGGALHFTAVGVSGTGALAVVAPLISGRTYTCTLTLLNYASGTIDVLQNGVTIVGLAGLLANGTYTATFIATGTSFKIRCNGVPCTVDIDNVICLDDVGATVTHDPNGGELIGGTTTLTQKSGEQFLVSCDGTGFQVEKLGVGNSQVIIGGAGNFTPVGGCYSLDIELLAPASGTCVYGRKFSYPCTPGVAIPYDATGTDLVFGWLKTAGVLSVVGGDTPVLYTATNKAIIVRWK